MEKAVVRVPLSPVAPQAVHLTTATRSPSQGGLVRAKEASGAGAGETRVLDTGGGVVLGPDDTLLGQAIVRDANESLPSDSILAADERPRALKMAWSSS